MPRAAAPADRAPSQRASIEMRTAEAQRADAERCLVDKQREEQESLLRRRRAEKAAQASADPGHLGQCYGRPPLVPFHHVLWYPMHGCHNEVNALLDESVHKHLALGADSKHAEVKSTCAKAQAEVNQLWRDAHLQKNIGFAAERRTRR